MFWYNQWLDFHYNVLREEHDRYWVRADDGYTNFVLKIDCELV